MKKIPFLLTAMGAVLVGAAVAGTPRTAARSRPVDSAQRPASFLVRNARVFDGERMLDNTSVLVRNGVIAAVGAALEPEAGVMVVDGTGRTLLPGFIDAHTHAFADALERALVFGVTTELDMFTAHEAAAAWRREQSAAAGAPSRADIFSAGTLVTAPKGHGTEYGLQIPTITSPDEAQAFVDARLAEGSDYIKIVFDDGTRSTAMYPSISAATLRAVIAAAKARNRLAVVHIASQSSAMVAIDAGAHALVHTFGNEAPRPDFGARAKAAGMFVVPTLSVNESASGAASGASLVEDQRLARFLTGAERTALNGSFPARPGSTQSLQHALDSVRQLRAAGVPILAGTDAPNPGTAHGASLHRELELLVRAGLTPVEALAAATSGPARAFALKDRGRIAPGLRADLLLVRGNPGQDIFATRDIEHVWKGGVRLDRREPGTEPLAQAPTTTGVISTFDTGSQPVADFGAGWQVSTDSFMGGSSKAEMRIVKPGARATAGALEIDGTIAPGAQFAWAGAMFYPAATPMAPANLSQFKEIAFWARGDGRPYQVMVFAATLGNVPAMQTFTPGADWKEFVMPLSAFQGIDGSGIRGVLFSAGLPAGAFRFAVDEVRLR
jgi:imidazolonepropionase-like amidohydrolase